MVGNYENKSLIRACLSWCPTNVHIRTNMMVGHRCSVFIFGHTRLEDFFLKNNNNNFRKTKEYWNGMILTAWRELSHHQHLNEHHVNYTSINQVFILSKYLKMFALSLLYFILFNLNTDFKCFFGQNVLLENT